MEGVGIQAANNKRKNKNKNKKNKPNNNGQSNGNQPKVQNEWENGDLNQYKPNANAKTNDNNREQKFKNWKKKKNNQPKVRLFLVSIVLFLKLIRCYLSFCYSKINPQ